MNKLLKVSLRQQAIIIPDGIAQHENKMLLDRTAILVANLAKLGYGVGPELLKALNATTVAVQEEILETLRDVMGMNKNWTPLVKGWNVPTGESVLDHLITAFNNFFGGRGTALPCGHIIPAHTFPLERYNGCPFCGATFQYGELEHTGQGSKLKVLEKWTTADAQAFLADLLASKTALDATQIDSLKILLAHFPLPAANVGMKETLMLVIDTLVEQQDAEKAQVLFSSPADVLRYLWYKHTGFLQIIEPKTILKRHKNNHQHIRPEQDKSAIAQMFTKAGLKLKYNRKQCLMVAGWLNNMDMDLERMCEIMHPKRAMWIRFIRALRLAEYSKRSGFEKLKELLDYFYNEAYTVWQGRVNHYRLRSDMEKTMELLKQRPGLFARSLFANMLWFGPDDTIAAFKEVIDKVPARLVLTLGMYADNYFNFSIDRIVKPLGGNSKTIPAHSLLSIYNYEELASMKLVVESLSELAVQRRFAAIENAHTSMYIDPLLYKIPVAIGDRSETVQDMPVALQGTRFAVEGDTVRLFMQWGVGLKAQHLDMDLSCMIAYKDKTNICSFSSLTPFGCKHSGDIRHIPEKIGTAEYIDIDLISLQKAGAIYVTFTCNAYTAGSITPNLVVGWMNSKYPMKISERTGVAYDPSCVQHQVRIVNNLSKGLVFGVLDVQSREIIWLEMPFGGQVVQNLDVANVTAIMQRLNTKLSIGNLLKIKAAAQGLVLTDTAVADEVYTVEWASNTAAVTKLLVD
ncbi:hypothetical protein SAMN05518672_101103 [Chitinophaga sp. CF118]|uniref:hypothetical protein n=1 Tax=Chitinophaga sp. CF118 TaxID=1884367 RepID=UPI0008F1CA5E|nr:hypothetical protein [Chitinophaga sp. CF118]SFD02613.1 hypothetical protein SAMN05518672_101103 [Chitinophaga sp. CF118]